MMTLMRQKIEISYKTILFTFFSLIFLWLLYKIRGIIILTFVCFLLASILSPLVEKMQKLKIPRVLGILLVYIFLIAIFSGVLSIIIPALIEQTSILAENLSVPIQYLPFLEQFDWGALSSQLELISKNLVGVIRIIISAASNFLTLFALLVITFYFLYEKQNLDKYLDRLFNNEKKALVARLFRKSDQVLGGWLRGQLLLMLIIGIMSYVGLTLLGVNYALPLALLAGLLEFIPNLGPTLALIPATLVGWSISPAVGVGTLILYIVIQQVENYLIVPQVMKKTTGLHPLLALLCLLVGGKLYGFVGALLAIPIFLLSTTIVKELYFKD